jgi:hypothetical protein
VGRYLVSDGSRHGLDEFDGDRIRHMTKIWNDAISMKQLGWA